MYCQVCGAQNPDDLEYCQRCQQKLLVLSGTPPEESQEFEEENEEENFSFDEHLLERISVLEEALKRTAETVRQLLGAIGRQERNILINETGLATLRELLEHKRVVGRDEWSDLWESRMDAQLTALEKRERFEELKDRIAGLYRGEKRELFAQLLLDAEYALFALDVRRALDILETAYKLDRDNHELAYFIGEIYFNEGEGERALGFLRRVLEAEPDHFEGLLYSGVIHYQRGEGAAAQEVLRRAVAQRPDSFLPNFSLGAVYAGQGHLKRAVALLERAIEVDPVPEALFLLGSCYYEMGKPGAAIRHLREAVRHDPAHEEAYHLLGLAYLDRRWNRRALEAFQQAERLNPKKMRYRDLVRFLSGQGESPLPHIGAEAGDWVRQAEEHLAAERPERALDGYRKALALEPDNPTLLMSSALVCLQLNRARDAESITRRVLELEPGEMLQATAFAALMEALRSEGRYREGNGIGRRLLEEGRSNFARAIAYYEMACNLAEMEEDLDQALEYARLSLEHSPEELRQFPLAAMGWVHFKRQEFDRAIELLSRSSELEASTTTLTQLGLALLASGQDDQAREVMTRAREQGRQPRSLEQRMMECMLDSHALLERVRQPQGR